MGMQTDIPVFTSSAAAGVAQIYSGTQCAQVGLAVALLPLRPDSAVTDARSNRSWQLATGNRTHTHASVTCGVTGAGCTRLALKKQRFLCFGALRKKRACTFKTLKNFPTNKKVFGFFPPLRALHLSHPHMHAEDMLSWFLKTFLSFHASEVFSPPFLSELSALLHRELSDRYTTGA